MKFRLIVLLCLTMLSGFVLQAAMAQEMNFPIPLGKKEKAMASAMMGPAMRAMFNGDRAGVMVIGMTMNPMFGNVFRAEYGITDEQMAAIRTGMTTSVQNMGDVQESFKFVMQKIEADNDYVVTEEDEVLLETAMLSVFNGMDGIYRETFSEEQVQKLEEAVFVMMGGLEASFLWDGSLDVLDLSEEQKTKLAELKTEVAPEKKKFLDEVERLMKKAVGDGKINLKDFEKFGEEFKETSEAIKKRVMEILTEEQLAKAATMMAKPPKFLAGLANIVPDWMPGINSWKPGDGAPNEKKERRRRKAFPQNEEKTEPETVP